MKYEESFVQRALAHHQSGETADAVSNYRLAIDANPNDADALHLFGLLLHEQGDRDQAIALISRAIAIRPDIAELHNSLGVVQMARGDADAAAKTFRTAISMAPTLAESHRNLGQLFYQSGFIADAVPCFQEAYRLVPDRQHAVHLQRRLVRKFKEARHFDEAQKLLIQLCQECPDDLGLIEDLAELELERDDPLQAIERCQQILKQDPTSRRTLLSLASLCERCNQIDKTVESCVGVLKQDPTSVAAHLLLGLVLSSRLEPQHRAKMDLQERDEMRERSLEHLRQAVKLAPSAETFDALGRALLRCGRHSDAIEMLSQSIDLDPQFATAHENLGRAWLEQGNLDAARKHFGIAIEWNPKSSDAQFELARLDQSDSRESIEALRCLLQRQDLSSQERMKLGFALARRLDKAGQHDDAFKNYSLANLEKLKARGPTTSRTAEELTGLLIGTFSKGYFAEHFRHDKATTTGEIAPVFIVGMPRSGTTLVEQILASHSSVFGAGELSDISDIANSLSRRVGVSDRYPESVLAIEDHHAQSIGNEYIARLSQMIRKANVEAIKVTDKMPTNFLHLGLIARLFPTARIVHLIRDPIDVCVSCFKQNLEWPFCDLTAAAEYLHQYRRLMDHWHQTLPLPIYDVHYEDIVGHQERESRRLIDFLELPWDPACMEFATSARAVQTPSKWQVRQPIYHSSVGAWKRYQNHLQKLVEQFAEGNASWR